MPTRQQRAAIRLARRNLLAIPSAAAIYDVQAGTNGFLVFSDLHRANACADRAKGVRS